jgi:hypothetical protein
MIFASMEKIGKACGGISRQAINKWVNEGKLIQNRKGKINIEHPENLQFLQDKGADFSVFYGKNIPAFVPINIEKKQKIKAAAKPAKVNPEVNLKPETVQEQPVKRVNQHDKPVENGGNSLERMLKIEKLKGNIKDNELKEIKLLEEKNRVFDREVVSRVLFDVVGDFVGAAMSIPHNVIDKIMSLRITNQDDEREQTINILTKTYINEFELILRTAKKKFGTMKNTDKKRNDNESESE